MRSRHGSRTIRLGSVLALGGFLSAAHAVGGCATEGDDDEDQELPGRAESALQATSLTGTSLPAKALALTFDDGPSARTAELSTYLKSQNIKATFFVNGGHLATTTLPNPNGITVMPGAAAVLAQLVADGHLVANHTVTHRDLVSQVLPTGAAMVVQELSETDTAMASSVPSSHFLFRAPYGSFNAGVYDALKGSAMNKYAGPVGWDVGGTSNDYPNRAADWACWQGQLYTGSTPANATGYATTSQCGDAYLAEITTAGRGIVLMHDPYSWANGSTVDMVKYMVPILKSRGYTFVRADEVPAIAALFPTSGANVVVLPRPPARVTPVFTDTYVAPFVQSGSGFTATRTTTTKASGTHSLSVTITTPGAAFGVAIPSGDQAYSGAGQTELRFAFNAGATVHAGIDTLRVAIEDDDGATPTTSVALKPYLVSSGSVAASTWYRVTIPTSALNPNGRPIRRVQIVNAGTLANVPFFVDDIALGWTDPSPTERLVYTDSAAPSFSVGGWSVTSATSTFRTTGATSRKGTFTGAWGALTFTYDWNLPAFPAGTHTAVSFDISGGSGTPPAALGSMVVGLNGSPTKKLLPYVPGGFKANTWYRVTIPVADLVTGSYRQVTFKNESTSLYSFYVDQVHFETDHTPPALVDPTVPPGDPDTFAPGETDVVTVVRTAEDRKPISPLIYGINGFASSSVPADVLASVTLVRRGGDRGNSYNWETNVSNGSLNNGFVNDMTLAGGTPNPNAPAAQDLALLAAHRPAGRAVMVPFVLNDWVSGPLGGIGAWNQPGWNRAQYFKRTGFVKPTAFAATPDLTDGMVYTDEHLQYLRDKYPGQDITAPGPGRLLVGIDNEPDLYPYNFPMLQSGTGAAIVRNGTTVGRWVKSEEFTQRMLTFARKVKQMAPQAHIVGPSHYHFDGWTTWWDENTTLYSNAGTARWYMDDFLATVRAASEQEGKRLLDTWDFHWYPQGVSNGTYVWNLDHATRALTANEIDQIVQGPRSYWDTTYDEHSWITEPWHLGGPTYVLPRLKARIEAAYPGTKIGVTEYNPGGRNHIASGLGVADSLGVFQRQGVEIAAFWPEGSATALAYAYGALKLLRNADGAGLRYADTDVRVEHPEIAESSVYAGSDTPNRVTVLVINKTNATRRVGVRAFNTKRLTQVSAYRIDAAHSSPFLVSTEPVTKVNAYAYAAPAMSATMLVFTAP